MIVWKRIFRASLLLARQLIRISGRWLPQPVWAPLRRSRQPAISKQRRNHRSRRLEIGLEYVSKMNSGAVSATVFSKSGKIESDKMYFLPNKVSDKILDIVPHA